MFVFVRVAIFQTLERLVEFRHKGGSGRTDPALPDSKELGALQQSTEVRPGCQGPKPIVQLKNAVVLL